MARKEVELVEQFEQAGIKVLAVCETKKDRVHKQQREGICWHGLKQEQRAAAGVACLVHRDSTTNPKMGINIRQTAENTFGVGK